MDSISRLFSIISGSYCTSHRVVCVFPVVIGSILPMYGFRSNWLSGWRIPLLIYNRHMTDSTKNVRQNYFYGFFRRFQRFFKNSWKLIYLIAEAPEKKCGTEIRKRDTKIAGVTVRRKNGKFQIGLVGLGKRSFTREVRFFIWSIQTEIGRFGSRLTSLGLRLWARVHQCISGSIRSYQGRSFRYQPPVSFKIHQLKIV